MELLGKAVDSLNSDTVFGNTNAFESLKSVFQKDTEGAEIGEEDFDIRDDIVIDPETTDKIANYLWTYLEQTNALPCGFNERSAINCIWDFLKKTDQLDTICNRIVDEVDGKQPKSDFSSKDFFIKALKILPIETGKRIAWEKLKKGYIPPSRVPEVMREELFTKIFNEFPDKAVDYYKTCFDLFVKLMDKKLDETKTLTEPEAKLFVSLTLRCTEKNLSISDKWKEQLVQLVPSSVKDAESKRDLQEL